ncbi:preprotein translocase subunit SecG [Seonamhaeicola maritimus]|uniref:Protein-export membrane protein SecG n=1 Tax=Seonamhaeicola maritimus TaxID=2591822 RepID=A0A5C7GGQ8_9FLAO|nr:preprotein translocase subunit SecG [Seonamhaeicola maritimus]TXG36559.1 preprotein translocase subunit SecG [Seonamhaeicola maritimus]
MGNFTIFLALIVIVAFLLIVVIMVQNPKGGGLSSTFGGGGSQQLGGVKKTTDFLDKSTWYLATFLLVLILASNVAINTGGDNIDSKALDTEAASEVPLPVPTAQPATDNTTAVDTTN